MGKKRQTNRHPRGYVTPKRRDRRVIAIFADFELFEWVHRAAARENTTIQEMVERLLQETMRRDLLETLVSSSDDLKFMDRQNNTDVKVSAA